MTTTGPESKPRHSDTVFAALLKYWRGHRGMSQLDLSFAAQVSARHISFLETGRSKPSPEMVIALAETLDVPMRDTNELLRAAGYAAHYPEPTVNTLLQGPLGEAVQTMLDHHEPFPIMVVDRLYNVMRTNHAAKLLFAFADVDIEDTTSGPVNLLRLLFDPVTRSMIGDWESVARTVLRRFQRETFHRPHDSEISELLSELVAAPGVPDDWRQPNLTEVDEPMLSLEFRAGEMSLSFLTTITGFNSPQNVTLDELRIESYFPIDSQTRELCYQFLAVS